MRQKAETVLQSGSGWGALENEKRRLADDGAVNRILEFDGLDAKQEQWLKLLKEGTLGRHDPNEVPLSWMLDIDFVEKMEEAIEENQRAQAKAGSDYVKLQEHQDQLSELEAQLEHKTERWMYLTELKEKIDAQSK